MQCGGGQVGGEEEWQSAWQPSMSDIKDLDEAQKKDKGLCSLPCTTMY